MPKEYPEIPGLEEDLVIHQEKMRQASANNKEEVIPEQSSPLYQPTIVFPQDTADSSISETEISKSMLSLPKQYEQLLIKYEQDIREHIHQECTQENRIEELDDQTKSLQMRIDQREKEYQDCCD